MAVDYGNFGQLARGTALVKIQQKMELPCIVALKPFNDIDGNPLLLRTKRKFNFGDKQQYLRKKIEGVPVPTFNEQMEENNFSLDTKIKSYSYVWKGEGKDRERSVEAFEWGIDTPIEDLYHSTMPMPELAWYVLDVNKKNGLTLAYIEPVDYKKLGLINQTGLFPPMVKNNGEISGKVYSGHQFSISLRTSEKDWWELSTDATNFYYGKENPFEKYPAEWQKKLISITTTIIRLEDFQKHMVFCVRNNTDFYVQNKLRVFDSKAESYTREMVFKLRRGFKGQLAHSESNAFREKGDEKKVRDFNCDLTGGSWVALDKPKNRVLYFNEKFPFQEWEKEYAKAFPDSKSWKDRNKGGYFIPTGGKLSPPFYTYEQYSKDEKTRLSNEEIASRPPHSGHFTGQDYGKGFIRFSKFTKGTYNKNPKRGKKQKTRFMTPEMLLWYIANDIIVADLKNPYYTREETKREFEQYIVKVKSAAKKYGIKPTFGVMYQIEKDIDNLKYMGET